VLTVMKKALATLTFLILSCATWASSIPMEDAQLLNNFSKSDRPNFAPLPLSLREATLTVNTLGSTTYAASQPGVIANSSRDNAADDRVPMPTALWLFSSVLFGFIVVSTRRRI
jgi:hypothetical protein